jgi:hypothetical protein
MGIAVSLIIIAVGAILAFAVNPSGNPSVDPNVAGWVLIVVGIAALILDLLLWEAWGPAYLRRRRVAYDAGYAARPAAPAPPPAAPARRTVVEDEVVDGPPEGPPPP